MSPTVPTRSYAEVKVIFDPNLLDARTGEPIEATITYESDDDGPTMVVTFGAEPPRLSEVWTVLAHALRAHAGAPTTVGTPTVAPGSEATR